MSNRNNCHIENVQELSPEEMAHMQGGDQQVYMTFTLKDCMVSSWQ